MAQEPDLLISAGFSDAQLVRETNKVVAQFRKRGEEAQKAFQDATGRVTNTNAARAHARELDRLSKAYDPVYRAASKYEAEVQRLDRALDVGAISQTQYTAKVVEAAREMHKAGAVSAAGADQFTRTAQRAQAASVAFDRGAQQAAAGAGRFRSQVQNSAFQLQDFVVQVQGGTAASVAFAQQAPQFLGAFGAMGAVLGLVAALAVPVGRALLSIGGDSEDAAKMAEEFDKSLQSARSALTEFNDTINTRSLGSIEALIEKYGRADQAVRDLENRMREAFRSDAFEGYQSVIDEQALGSLIGADSQVARVFGRVQELRQQAATARDELNKLLEFDESASMQGQFGALRMLQQGQIEGARSDMERLNAEVERFGVTPEQISTFTQAKDALDAALAEQNFTGAIDALDTIQAVLRETGDTTLINVANQLDTVAAQLQEGAAQAGELPPELAAAADEALALADYLTQAVGAINSLQSAISNLGISNVGKQARLAALQAGQSAGEATIAGRVAERRAELEETFNPNDANFTGIQRELSQYEEGLREELKLTEQIDKLEDQLKPKRGSRGGGGGKKRVRTGRGQSEKTAADILDDGAQDLVGIERQIELIGKSNEQVAVARARWEMLDAAKKAGIPVNETLMQQIDAQAQQFGRLTGELERAEQSQQQFDDAVNGIADSMAGALIAGESLREGLAQVLKGIASDILNSGIRNALMSQFGGGGGFNFGSLFGGGDKLSGALRLAGARANGGPVSGGSAYLVGERGPEIIVPRADGMVIPNHKIGGGGGDMNININVSGARGNAEIQDMVASGVQRGLASYDKALPGRVQQVQTHPRRR